MPALSQVHIEARWFGVEYANERRFVRANDDLPVMGARFAAMGFPSGTLGLPARDPGASPWHGTLPYADLREARGLPAKMISEIDQGRFGLKKLHRAIFNRISALLSDLPHAPAKQRNSESPNLSSDAVFSKPASGCGDAFTPTASAAPHETASNSLRFATLRAASLPPVVSSDASEIADQFRSLRKSLRLSRLDAAQRLGCTLETVVVLENGYASVEASSAMLGVLSEQSIRP